MSGTDNTTLRLAETAAGSAAASLWIVWSGRGSAPPIRLLGAERLPLGRGAAKRGRLDFEGVSRKHAELFEQGPLVGVRDLGSTNGTFQSGERVDTAAESSAPGPGSRS